MSLNAKVEKKKGVVPMVHSVLDVLVSHIVDAFQAGLLRVCQHNVPDSVTHMAQSIGNAEPETVDWIGVHLQGNVSERSRGLKPLVKFDSVLHPSVVQALWGLIQHHLKDHVA